LIFLFCDIKMEVKVKNRHLSVNSILYFKIIWINEMQIITESRIVR